MNEFYKTIAGSSPKLVRGLVQCKICKKIQKVDSSQALQTGWPKCHGYTMTLDVELIK